MTYDFEEYLNACHIPHNPSDLYSTKSVGKILAASYQYCHEGDFPESISFRDKRTYAENVYQKVLLGDIAARNNIRQLGGLRILIKKIAETVGQPVSYTKLCNIITGIGIKLSKDTVISYVRQAEEAYLLFDIKNYYAKFNDKESNSKFYFFDNALLNLFLFKKDSELLENIIAHYLLRRYGRHFYYLQLAKTGIDIDFYLPESGTAVQSAYSIADPAARERETKNLVKLSKSNVDLASYIIVTMEEEEIIEAGNIRIEVIPLYKFLLGRHLPVIQSTLPADL